PIVYLILIVNQDGHRNFDNGKNCCLSKSFVMKKFYTVLFAGILHLAPAQVPNSTFEAVTGEDLTQVESWGRFFTPPVSIDMETGQPTAEEIIFGDGAATFCSSVTEAHSGNRALRIRNAFNVTQNKVIAG